MKRLFVRFVAPLALACLTVTPVSAQEVVEIPATIAVCSTTVKTFPYFTQAPLTTENISRIAEVTVSGTPCSYSFVIRHTNGIDYVYQLLGDNRVLCVGIDDNTVECKGTAEETTYVGFGDRLGGSYPSTVRVKPEGGGEVVTEFRGRAIFVALFRKLAN